MVVFVVHGVVLVGWPGLLGLPPPPPPGLLQPGPMQHPDPMQGRLMEGNDRPGPQNTHGGPQLLVQGRPQSGPRVQVGPGEPVVTWIGREEMGAGVFFGVTRYGPGLNVHNAAPEVEELLGGTPLTVSVAAGKTTLGVPNMTVVAVSTHGTCIILTEVAVKGGMETPA